MERPLLNVSDYTDDQLTAIDAATDAAVDAVHAGVNPAVVLQQVRRAIRFVLVHSASREED